MDHVVFLDAKAKEQEKLLSGQKCMVIRGAAGRKLPHGRVKAGDTLYFIENNGSGIITARATAKSVLCSEKLTEDESAALIAAHMEKLRLTDAQLARWSGKKHLVLIEVEGMSALSPFKIDRSQYSNMDDWLIVGDIESVRN